MEKEQDTQSVTRFERLIKNQSGLTLIELLIALVISGALLAAMVMTFFGQSRSYNNQQEITALQENLWAAMQLMSRDIRMAGYDQSSSGNFGITVATSGIFTASEDLNDSAVATPSIKTPEDGEYIQYSLSGVGPYTLNRTTYKADGVTVDSTQPVINNISQLYFNYEIVQDNGASNPWSMTWTQTPSSSNIKNISVVKVCLQGRTARPTTISGQTTINPPITGGTWNPASAGRYQYRTMCVEIKLRNQKV